MRKNLHYKVLTSVLAIAGLYFYNAPAAWAEITYEDNRIKGDGTAISIVTIKLLVKAQIYQLLVTFMAIIRKPKMPMVMELQ